MDLGEKVIDSSDIVVGSFITILLNIYRNKWISFKTSRKKTYSTDNSDFSRQLRHAGSSVEWATIGNDNAFYPPTKLNLNILALLFIFFALFLLAVYWTQFRLDALGKLIFSILAII